MHASTTTLHRARMAATASVPSIGRGVEGARRMITISLLPRSARTNSRTAIMPTAPLQSRAAAVVPSTMDGVRR